MHGVPHIQARAQLQVARLEHAFQQQQRAAPAQGAQALGFGQVEQGKAIGCAQGVEHALDAMAVGIGLDHGPHARVLRRRTAARQVVPQRSGVDGGKNRARHGSSWASKTAPDCGTAARLRR